MSPSVLNLLLRLRGVRLKALPDNKRTYVVLEHEERIGEISFSAYEKQHTGRGWRVSQPAAFEGARYRSRWTAAWSVIRSKHN